MSHDRITKYYLLCTIRMGQKTHIVDMLDSAQLNIVFTKKEADLYLRKMGDHYTARETIIGGYGGRGPRQPIIVI